MAHIGGMTAGRVRNPVMMKSEQTSSMIIMMMSEHSDDMLSTVGKELQSSL